MTKDELNSIIDNRKMNAWATMRTLNRATPAELIAFGHRGQTQAEAMQQVFRRALVQCEALIQQWEKENPKS